jgi:hypothetical protein
LSGGTKICRPSDIRFSRKADTGEPWKERRLSGRRPFFAKAIKVMPLPLEHIEVNSPDGILAALNADPELL